MCQTRLTRGTLSQAQKIKACQSTEKTIEKNTFSEGTDNAECKNPKQTSEFPQVIASRCTGCGKCIDACRLNAISLQNSIAVINTAKCVNCRLCKRLCPSGAIA